LRVCAPCLRCLRLDVARRRSGVAAVCVRPRAPLRGRPASRRRPGRSERQPSTRPGGRNGLVRWHGADRGQDGVDPDAVRLHSHARPPRVDRGRARGARGGRLGRRDRRAERRGRPDGALRLSRHAHDERSAGLRRSADPAAFARCQPRRLCGQSSRGRRCAGSGRCNASRPRDLRSSPRVDG
jgi:hypothetical protein